MGQNNFNWLRRKTAERMKMKKRIKNEFGDTEAFTNMKDMINEQRKQSIDPKDLPW